jgi:ribosomal protein S18 acetylase RimI-like enzyme
MTNLMASNRKWARHPSVPLHATGQQYASWTIQVAVWMGLALLSVNSSNTVQAFGVLAPSALSARTMNPPSCAFQAISERAAQNEASITSTSLEATSEVPAGSSGASAGSTAKSVTAIPFVIERVRDMGQNNMQAYFEISKVCIEAFFNDSNETTSATPFWKSWQLAYLRTLQSADLERRRRREGHSNIMLVARAVEPASLDRNHAHTPLLLDMRSVYNVNDQLRDNDNTVDFVRGDLLGFVEITLRYYGLGDSVETQRPVLTNLAVVREARRCGVGSALVHACERAVRYDWPGHDELILEVEDDNEPARQFYERLGYQVVGSDPASRRYDTSGWWLQKVRCTRLILRKQLDDGNKYSKKAVMDAASSVVEDTVNMGRQVFQRIRDNLKG